MYQKSHFKETMKIALPISLGQMGHILANISDNIMLGQYGNGETIYMAAAAFASSVFFLFMLFALGVTMGITPQIAQSRGAGNLQNINPIFQNTLLIYLGLAIVQVFIFELLPLGFDYFKQPTEVIRIGTPYFKIIGYSIVPIIIFQLGKQYAEGFEDTFWAMVISLGSNLLNIFLNYLMIFGKMGFREQGINGAGYATLISRCVMAFFMIWYVFKNKSLRQHFQLRFNKLSKHYLSEGLRYSIPMGIQFTVESSAFVFATILVGTLGTTTLAAHQIGFNVAAFTFILTTGLSAAATVRIGYFYGASQIEDANDAFKTTLKTVIIYMAFTAVMINLLKSYIPTLYNVSDTNIAETTTNLLVIASMFQLFDGIQIVCMGALRGIGDIKIPMWISVLAYWVICLPIGYYITFEYGLGVSGIWYGFVAGLSVSALLLYFRFMKLMNTLSFN